MPGARAHDMITMISAVAAAPVALVIGLTPGETAALTGSYLLGGLFFSPDLDLHSTPYMRWGVLRVLWWPYQVLVPHRHWVSHSLVVGPLLRLLYFTLMAYGLGLLGLLLLNLLTPVDLTGTLWTVTNAIMGYIRRHPALSAYVLGGLMASGSVHVIVDVLWSGFKRRRRRLVRGLRNL